MDENSTMISMMRAPRLALEKHCVLRVETHLGVGPYRHEAIQRDPEFFRDYHRTPKKDPLLGSEWPKTWSFGFHSKEQLLRWFDKKHHYAALEAIGTFVFEFKVEASLLRFGDYQVVFDRSKAVRGKPTRPLDLWEDRRLR